MAFRERRRFFDGTVSAGANHDYVVAPGFHDVVTSITITNFGSTSDLLYRVQINPGTAGPYVAAGQIAPGSSIILAPWLSLASSETLRMSNLTVAIPTALLYYTASGVRYMNG